MANMIDIISTEHVFDDQLISIRNKGKRLGRIEIGEYVRIGGRTIVCVRRARREAVYLIKNRIIDRVLEKIPNMRFLIVGENPPKDIFHPHIEFTGFVDDIVNYIQKANVVIVPIVRGGGIRMKILESLACGKTIISTFKGAVGIPNIFKNLRLGTLDDFYIKPAHNWGGNIDLDRKGAFFSVEIRPCTFPWYSLTIFWDGTVVPCPQDFFGEIEIGNINESTLSEIWNSNRMIYLRKKMIAGKYDVLKPCNSCDRLLRKTILGSFIPKENFSTFFS